MLQTVFTYIVFFMIGFVQDFIITIYYRAISKERPLEASILSSAITLINIFVLYELVSGVDSQPVGVIIAYALGNGIATYLAVKLHGIKKKGRKKMKL